VSYLTVPEVAELARCEHKAVRRAIHSGALEAFQVAGRILVREEAVHAWVMSRPVARSGAPRASSAAGPAPQRRRSEVGSVDALRKLNGGRV
jgi:excisionase family DNA binding protein